MPTLSHAVKSIMPVCKASFSQRTTLPIAHLLLISELEDVCHICVSATLSHAFQRGLELLGINGAAGISVELLESLDEDLQARSVTSERARIINGSAQYILPRSPPW